LKDGTLAIDLGSSSTVVAFQAAGGGAIEILSVAPFSSATSGVIPSLIWVVDATADQVLVGRQVQEAGLARSDSPQLCRDFKRRIGAADKSPGQGSLLSPEQAGALFLQRIWDHLPPGLAPSRLVLTAPIDGYRGYRQWLERASASLAVEEVALVDEPTAAAIGAGLPPGSRVLVVDLGGGTIDFSLVALEGGQGRAAPIAQLLRFGGRDLRASRQALRCARVLGKAGLALGGRDLDRWIAAALIDGPPSGALLEAVEQLKCRLSAEQEAGVLWCPPGETCRELRFNRPALESLLKRQGLMDLLDDLLERALAGARAQGLDLPAIDAVLPVGGSSRIPLIRAWLQERCSGVAILDQRPIEAVAVGALALTPGVQIRDVLSRGVSLRRWDPRSEGYRWHPLFLAGQSWPTGQPLELVLACSQDGQRQLDLVLGEPVDERRAEVVFRDGLPELSRRPAGEIRVEPWTGQPAAIDLDPPGTRGVDRLRLHFRIDGQARLTMDSQDLIGGQRSEGIPLGPVR
jgi:molecular chaperone DnaK (HSP70)